MSDLKERMQVLDEVEAPQLWSRIQTHVTRPPEPRSRIAATVISMLVAMAAVGGIYFAYRDTAREPIRPGPRLNGPIYFSGGEKGPSLFGPSSLYAVDPDGTRFRMLSGPGQLTASGIDVSPDGRVIAMSIGGGEFSPKHIFLMQSDGSGLRQITEGPSGSGPGHPFPQEIHPDWSPDGREIVFASTRCCDTANSLGNYALYIVRPDGTGLRELTRGSGSLTNPAWSPDGSQVAYVDVGSASEIWITNADGSDPRALTKNGRFNKALSWSPDGKYLAYATEVVNGEDWQVHVIRADGAQDRAVYTCKDPCLFGGFSLDWSPDGKEIAFTFSRARGRGRVSHIGLISPDGNGFRVLDTHGIQPVELTWASSR